MATWESEFTTPGTSARIWLVLQVDLVSQNIANNTSTLNWYLRMEERVNASPYNLAGTSSANATVNALVYNAGGLNYDFRGTNATVGIASGTTVVSHNADGTKTITVAAAYNGGSPLGTASFSTTWTLPTIPRATQPTVSPTSGQTGSTFTIGHSPATSSFYHDVAYSLDGGATYTDIQTDIVGADTSTDWTPAHSLLPDVTSATAIIRLITRASSGGTIIGTKTVNLPLTVPSSVKPTVSSVAWEDAQTSSPDIPTLMGGAGRFVQRWSKLKPTVTSAGAGGSSVTGATVTQAGQTTNSGTAFANPINSSGAVSYAAVATDTRGRASDPFYDTVAVKAYNFPNLPTPAVARTSDAGGATPSPTGTYLRITPAASVSSLNFGDGEKNLLEWRVRTRLKGAGSWTTVQDWTAATVSGATWTTPKVIGGYASSNEYEVEVSIRDLFGKNGFDTGNTIKTLTVPVPSESVFMDWNAGIGIGLGQYHTGSGARLQVTGGIEQDGNAVIDAEDLATDSVAGIVKLATSAETIAGTDDSRTVTPAGLAALTATTSRRGLVEIATDAETLALSDTSRAVTPASLAQNGVVGKRRVTPSAVSKAGGGTVVVDADGTVRVTVAGVTAISLDGLFRPGKNYEIDIIHQTAAAANNTFRFRKAGTDQTPNAYVFQGVYGSGSWGGSYAASAYGAVSTSALLTVNGQTFAHSTLRIINSDATSSMGWSFNSMTRSGSTSTFYIGNGDFAPTDCTGFTLIAGATTFSPLTTIKVWELL